MLLAIVLAASLPEIVHVHSAPFCTTLRDNIAPAVAALRASDRLVSRHPSARTLDSTPISGLRAEQFTDAMVRNMAIADDALESAARFPATPGSDEARLLAEIKAQLLQIKRLQSESVNLIYGMSETQALALMQEIPSDGVAPEIASPPHTAFSSTPLTSAFGDPPGWTNPYALLDRTFPVNDPNAGVDDAIMAKLRKAIQLEQTLTPQIERLVLECQ